jgi:hypothetical protein
VQGFYNFALALNTNFPGMVKLQKWTSKFLWVMLYITPIILASMHFGGKLIKKKLIAELNKSLLVKAEVNYIEFSGFSNLPRIGVTFHNLKVDENGAKLGGHLFQAEKMSVLVNPIDLLASTPSIDRILIQGARTRILNDGERSNFLIFKSDSSSANSEMNLDIKHVSLKDVAVLYVQPDAQLQSEFRVNKLTLKGQMNSNSFTLNSKGDLFLETLRSQNRNRITYAPIGLDLDVKVDREVKSYSIQKGSISIHEMQLEVSGDILELPDGLDVDLKLAGSDFRVDELVKLADYSLENRLKGLKGKGAISANGSIKGIFSEDSWPKIQGDVRFDNVSAEDPNTGFKLSRFHGDVRVDNDKEIWKLAANIEELKTSGSQMEGDLTIENLEKGIGESKLKGRLDFEEWQSYLNPESISSMSGVALFNLKAAFSDAFGQIRFSDLNGDVELRRLHLKTPVGQKLESGELNIHLNQNATDIKMCMGRFNEVDFNLTGKATNLIPYLISDDRLKVKGNLRSKDLNIDKLVYTPEEPEVSEESSKVAMDIGVDLDLQVAAQKFQFSMLEATDLRGNFIWEKGDLKFEKLAFNAWEGKHTFDGSLKTISDGFTLNGIYDTKGANIHQVFKEFDNFQQNELTHENLWGKITSNGVLQVDFDENFDFIEDQIELLSEVVIVDGRLKEYSTLESLSTFVHVDDLKDVKFDRLENQIRIAKGVIYIPQMDIKSTAMDLSIAGSHNFDNYMEYKVALKVSELLASKSNWIAKKKERGLDQDERGSLTAYIQIIGTPEDLKIKYDRETVKEKLKEERKKESETFKKNLRDQLRGRTTTGDKKDVEWDE